MSSRFLNRNIFGDEKNKNNLMSIADAHALLQEWVPNEMLPLEHPGEDQLLIGRIVKRLLALGTPVIDSHDPPP